MLHKRRKILLCKIGFGFQIGVPVVSGLAYVDVEVDVDGDGGAVAGAGAGAAPAPAQISHLTLM